MKKLPRCVILEIPMGQPARELNLREAKMKLILRLWFFVFPFLLGGFFFLEAALAQPQIQAPTKSRPVILEFSRELCPMCEYMEKTLGQLKAKYGDQIEVRILHYDSDEKLFKQYEVVFVPTQLFLDASGKEVFRHIGVFTLSELEKKLKQLKMLQTP
jgi:thiol-disulfide isomerase/thioredoxin